MKKVTFLILALMLVMGFACTEGFGKIAQPKATKVTLNFLNDQVEAVEGGAAIAFRQALDRVRKEHPEITIEEDSLTNQSLYTKVKTLAAANELPELYVAKADLVEMLISNKLIGAIDKDIKADLQWKNQFLPGVFDKITYNGKIYGIPCTSKSTSLVFYNQNIFKECGITRFPQNWSEFKAAVAKIKAKGYTPIALGNKEQWVAQSCILSTLADRFTGTDWFFKLKNRKGAKFTDPEFVKTLQAIADLAAIGAFNSDMNSLDNMQQRTIYYNKKAAMFIEGAWAIGDLQKDCPADVLAATQLTLLPLVEGGKGKATSMSGGASVFFVMNNLTGSKRTAAVRVLKELSGPEFGSTMTEYNKFPAVKPGKYDTSKIAPLAKQYNELAARGSFVPVYDIQLTSSLIDVINSGLQQLLIGSITPKDLAMKIQAEYDKESK
jgi:raffinose/stachyose/melibiose transport system substrate-binding protein